MTPTIIRGDARHLPLAGASVDAIVTDPPYELNFMGRAWDATGVAYDVDMWSECLRVLKPGGHLLAFGGTRTYHRMVCAIEDAGFEIRDSIHWIAGSGFPKSLDVSKAIDKAAVAAPLWDDIRVHLRHWRDRQGMTNAELNLAVGGATNGGGRASAWMSTEQRKPELPSKAQWARLREVLRWDRCPLDDIYDQVKDGAARPVLSEQTTMRHGGSWAGQERAGMFRQGEVTYSVTGAATDDARRWSGWGTALKPAHEPIVCARKPLSGTVAATVLEHGTGALNIDACRTGWDAASLAKDTARRQQPRSDITGGRLVGGDSGSYEGDATSPSGRWPTNVVLTHSASCAGGCAPDCPVAEMDRQSGVRTSGSRKAGTYGLMGYMGADAAPMPAIEGDSGGASRFFPVFRYEAKAPASERPRSADGTAHATVKPLALLRWLTRLVTQPGGLVLDPFLGSGTTAEACVIEGFRCIGIERDETHLPLIKARLAKPIQPTLGLGEAS